MDFNESNIDNISEDMTVNAMHLKCPEPIMLLHNKIREINNGSILKLLASDPSTDRDITRFCDFLGHDLLYKKLSTEKQIFLIKKNNDKNHS